MDIVSRASWGALPPAGPLSAWGSVLGSTVHWEGADIDPAAPDYAGIVRSIQAYHQGHPTENYSDIAYNFLVAPNGVIYEGRGWGYRSGANGTAHANLHYLAFCYLGGPNTPFTPAGQSSMDWLIRLAPVHHPLATDVKPHSYWVPTACPGPTIRTWITQRSTSTPVPEPTSPTIEDDEVTVYIITDKDSAGHQPWAATNWLVKRILRDSKDAQLGWETNAVNKRISPNAKYIDRKHWDSIPTIKA
jgi:hypothetical protein